MWGSDYPHPQLAMAGLAQRAGRKSRRVQSERAPQDCLRQRRAALSPELARVLGRSAGCHEFLPVQPVEEAASDAARQYPHHRGSVRSR